MDTSNSKKSIDKLVVDGQDIKDNFEVANLLNRYYVSIGAKLDKDIPYTSFSPLSYVRSNPHNFFLYPVQPHEICSLIDNLKKSSNKLDSLPCSFLKFSSNLVSYPLPLIINESFKSGVFPNQLEHAEVVPIFKGGDVSDINNYWPISMLPLFSELFEKCMAKRLVDFFTKFSLFSPDQFGFQKKK